MQSRSASSGREALQKWHDLAGRGEFTLVQSCSNEPDHWHIGLNLDYLAGKELPEPLRLYFLVHQTDPYLVGFLPFSAHVMTPLTILV